MNRRSLLIVAALAIVAVALAVVGQRRPSAPMSTGAELLPELAAVLDRIERITVSRGGGEAVATLVPSATGWGVAEKDGYPADVAKIRQALTVLAEARILEEKTSDPDFYDRLGVEPIGTASASGVVVAIDAAGVDLPPLILGDEASGTGRYVRRADEAPSFLIDRNPDVPRNTVQWLMPDIVDIRGASVQSIVITHADGERVEISKENPEQTDFAVADIPEGRELSYPGVANAIGNTLRELKLEDVASAVDDEAAEPAAVTEVRTFDGLVVTITSTAQGDEMWMTFAARHDGGSAAETPAAEEAADTNAEGPAQAEAINTRVRGWRYRIPTYQYDQLTRRLDDLLKAPA